MGSARNLACTSARLKMTETTVTLIRTNKSRAVVMTITRYTIAPTSSVGSCATHRRRWEHLGFGRSFPKASVHHG